jgi:hypothetical protein
MIAGTVVTMAVGDAQRYAQIASLAAADCDKPPATG